jgi:integrase
VGSSPTPGALDEGLSDSFKASENKISLTMAQIQQATIHDYTQEQLEKLIDSITQGLSRKSFNTNLKQMAKTSIHNTAVICQHIIAEQTELNIKPSTSETKIKVLVLLSRYLNNKPFEDMTKQDILAYLNSLRKPLTTDPSQCWLGTYNGRQIVLNKFFRWLYNPEEPDHRLRVTPPCMRGVKRLPRKTKSPYEPSDIWDAREHSVFLKYCPSARDRCYHSMACDMSARPHELLNLKISDLHFKLTDEGVQYAEVLITGGKTKPRTIPIIDSLPYVKEWVAHGHPTGTNKDSWLFVSVTHSSFGIKLRHDGLLSRYQYYYKTRYFPNLLNDNTVPEPDNAIIRNMLTKPWNLYIFRHSALTEKSQILTESTLRDHAGWTSTSKMPAVYLHYFGTESAKKLLEAKGIIKHGNQNIHVLKSKPCPNCQEANKPDAKFCLKCKMILTYDAYEEKTSRIERLEETVHLLVEGQKEYQELMKYKDLLESMLKKDSAV